MVVRIANFPRLGTEMAEGFSPRTVVYKYLQNTYFLRDHMSEVLVLGSLSKNGVVLLTPDKPENVSLGDRIG